MGHARFAQDKVSFDSPPGRWLLAVAVLGSGIAFLDATVVNVALPEIGRDLHASTSTLQWILNGYTLTLASLILLGGSLGDRYGRRCQRSREFPSCDHENSPPRDGVLRPTRSWLRRSRWPRIR